MYCKYCGKQIDVNSNFCCYCGGKLDGKFRENTTLFDKNEIIKVQVEGKVRATIWPQISKSSRLYILFSKINHSAEIIFTRIRKFITTHTKISQLLGMWCFINLILLIAGKGNAEFWPHIYFDRNGNYITTLLNPYATKSKSNYFSGSRADSPAAKIAYALSYTKGTSLKPPLELKIDWNTDLYGMGEFAFYVFFMPLLIFYLYRLYNRFFSNCDGKHWRYIVSIFFSIIAISTSRIVIYILKCQQKSYYEWGNDKMIIPWDSIVPWEFIIFTIIAASLSLYFLICAKHKSNIKWWANVIVTGLAILAIGFAMDPFFYLPIKNHF